MRELNAQFSKC